MPLGNMWEMKEGKLLNKAVTIIDAITGSFGITQYKDKQLMTITNLVEIVCLTRYPRPI